jgi:hypothetical protein
MSPPSKSRAVIFEAETPTGSLVVEIASDGLLFIAAANELTGRKKFLTESVRWFHGQLKQWLLKKESRRNHFQLAFRQPPAADGMTAAPRTPPPVMLSYDETAEMEEAIGEWLAGLKAGRPGQENRREQV